MNYEMPGMEIMFPELLVMFDTAKVEIKKEYQVSMVSKTTSFEKGKGKEGNFMDGKSVAAPVKKPKVELKPETKCFYYEENGR